MEKKLIIRPVPRRTGEIPQPEGPPIKYEAIDLGTGKRPRYVVVLRGGSSRVLSSLCTDLGGDDTVDLHGAPIVWLPLGADLEVYEVD